MCNFTCAIGRGIFHNTPRKARTGFFPIKLWSAGFALQSAPAASGSFTNIPGATSPYTNPISGGQQFFRLISD
jgi:hypothetical protein